ncbi:hypothetical protein PFISCL1PPCAC_8026, partial [Pristionchus fissidentatus]
ARIEQFLDSPHILSGLSMRRRNNPDPSSPSTPTHEIPASPISFTTTTTEDIPTPYPTPGRAIFGFVLHCFGILFTLSYLVWLWVPTPVLESLSITYVPAKLWAILLPLLIPILIALFVLLTSLRNWIVFRGVFDDIQEVTHDFKDD